MEMAGGRRDSRGGNGRGRECIGASGRCCGGCRGGIIDSSEGVEGEEIMTEEGFPAATTRGGVEVEAAGVATLEMEAEAAGMAQEVGTLNKAEEEGEAAEKELEEAAVAAKLAKMELGIAIV